MTRARFLSSFSKNRILHIAIPAIVANITTPLLAMADIAIVGHIGSASYIGAIAIGGSVFNMIYWLLNFLRMGSSGMTAQAVGRNDIASRNDILRKSLSIGIVSGAIIVLISPLIASIIIPFMEADAPTLQLAERYFRITVWGAPAVLATYSMTGWLLGCQNSAATMWTALITNLINISISIILVIVWHLKIDGVAYGTLAAQWVGAGMAFFFCQRIYRKGKSTTKDIAQFNWKKYFSVNRDIFLRTACIVAVTLWFTREGARLGTDILAANAVLMQLFSLFSFFMDGFAFAGEALGGRCYGAGNLKGFLKVRIALLKWGIYLGACVSAAYFLAGELIFRLLTDEIEVRNTARDFLPWIVTVPLVSFMAFVYDGLCIGMTKTRIMLISIVSATAVYFSIYFMLLPDMGNHALWLAFCCYLLTRSLILHILTKRDTEKLSLKNRK